MGAGLRTGLSRLVALAFGCSVALVAGEVAVRRLRPQPFAVMTNGLYAPDPPGRFGLRPGHTGIISNRVDFSTEVRINSLGFRGPEPGPPAPGSRRILVLGDSYAFGWGVAEEETFCARLPAALTSDAGTVSCLNGGVPGYRTDDEVAWLERHGIALAPDLVVLTVYVGNDLKDAVPGADPIELRDGLVGETGARYGPVAWLNARSHLVQLLQRAAPEQPTRWLRTRLGRGRPWEERNLRAELESFERTTTPRYQAALEAIDRELERLARLGREHRFRIVALLVPHAVQLKPDTWRVELSRLGIDPARLDPDAPSRHFRNAFARHDIPVVDTTPTLAAAQAAGEEMMFRHDHHWNRRGHELVAGLLAERLEREGWLQARETTTEPGPLPGETPAIAR